MDEGCDRGAGDLRVASGGGLAEALDNLEKFQPADTERPVLIPCVLVHAQFEMIDPSLDGNGRVGRLVITLLLAHRGCCGSRLRVETAGCVVLDEHERLAVDLGDGGRHGQIDHLAALADAPSQPWRVRISAGRSSMRYCRRHVTQAAETMYAVAGLQH